ncbi:MAG: CRISPR-associated helicase Cas3' [Chloroflexi bacterium]|nr:CRISPR-associated helicase Cas3' [Chloroflexota bacterium]
MDGPHRLLWAKYDRDTGAWHPLWKHLLDSAAMSLALPAPVISPGWEAEATAFLVGLHDVGKADSCFQHQIPQLSDGLVKAGFPITVDARCRHERLSAKFIKNKLKEGAVNPYVADATARVVVAHHGYWDENGRDVGQQYAEAQNRLCHLLELVLDLKALPCESPPDLSAFGMRLTGHVVLSDWLASNEKFFMDARLMGIEDPGEYFTVAQDVAKGWVTTLGFEQDPTGAEANRVVESPRPIQTALLDHLIPPGLVIIEAPMGEGKTEAAWILAEKWRDEGYRGMYMALPTMATSDSLYVRYRDAYLKKLGRAEKARLVHGMAWLRDDEEPEKPPAVGETGDDRDLAAAWFRPTRKAMLAAHGVGTVDQAMLAGMNVKFGFLRLYGLADRVLVIDEVHAYDAYMSAIITRLLQWCACLKIPVVLLSATLSAKQRTAMIGAYGATGGDAGPEASYPLITVAEAGQKAWVIEATASSTKKLRIVTHPGLLGDAKKTAAKAMGLVRDGGCCCVILNTVKQAQAVYRALDIPKGEKLLFHARFTASHRHQIAEKVLDLFGKDTTNRPARFVLVATQVVEQSLDVDFDSMISEIAPIDLLLQRSGRMHRHSVRECDPTLHVLLPEDGSVNFGGTGYVYADKPLLRTLAILACHREAQLPKDFRMLIDRCYGSLEWEQSAVSWEAIRRADLDWNKETEVLQNQARQFALREPSKRFFLPVSNDPTGDDSDDGNGWRAKTRLGANDRTAILVEERQLQRLEPGEVWMKEVRSLYQGSLKLPNYLPMHSPAPGYSAAVEAKGKLRGLTLLPLAGDGYWKGIDDKGNLYEVAYDEELGLLAGRVQ